jgi:hypothetical protein
MSTRHFDLPLARDYVRHWGLTEAIREIVQNAIDSDSPFEYAFMGDCLSITSRYTTLDAKTLILGSTSKADDKDKIGSFGEGYKLALLVLLRLGYNVQVLNGDKLWTPSFVHSELYDSEILRITETPVGGNQGLSFLVQGIGNEDANRIRNTCLFMQPPMTDVIGTKYGHILPSRPGFLYVGGLMVTTTDLDYGYDILPQHIKLERDRQTVADWDLMWLIKNMWLDTQRWADVADLMERQVPDVKSIQYDCPEILKEVCYRKFKEANPGAIAVGSQKELEAVVAKGMVKTVIIGGSYHAAVTSYQGHRDTYTRHMKVQTPAEILAEWLEKNQREMRLPIRIAFKQLLALASKWKA